MNITPVFYSAIAGTATILGLLLVLFAGKFVKKYSYYVVSLAAGVLLGTAFFHLFPEATELVGESAFQWVLLGFVIFYLIEVLIGFHVCDEDDPEHCHVLGPVAGLGIFFHSILDGVAIAIGFEVSHTLGLITAVAVMIHEFPEGIFTLSLLLHGGMKKKRAILLTILVALATPFGAFATLLLFPNLEEITLGYLLAIAGGSFLYISASDLIPETHRSRSIAIGVVMLLGLMIMYLIH